MNLQHLLSLYPCVAAPVLATYFRADCCLNATRITMEVMREFGFKCRPQPVMAIAMNAEYYKRVIPHGEVATGALLDQWIAEGAYILGTDTRHLPDDAENGRWAGHLTAIVEDRDGSEYLVDASCGQMRREQHSIFLPDVLIAKIPLPDPMFWEQGTVVYYDPVADESYRVTSGFERHSHNLQYARLIAEELRERSRKVAC